MTALLLTACLGGPEDVLPDDIASSESLLTAAERRVRAGQIRDAAAANGITQGWLLAGIADAETNMSHCWSELTWACQGPNSADCGGGPVVAGAGDGACSLMQGGLGMFQFDAGTYSQTLAREGNRILSIAGNVAAGVDFVVAMVIRSAYVAGVSTNAEAIDWINGVRIGNGRWDAWVRTVTHYYNGCAPSYSCFPSRYASYRDKTANVYNEMGADFWDTTTDFAAEYVSQTFPLASMPFELYPGEEAEGYIELRNVGAAAWMPGVTNLGTTQPRDGASPLAATGWISPGRAATVDRMVMPGGTGRFVFSVRGPTALGDYPQYFNVVQEGAAWFSDQGGPPDNQLQVRVTVIAAPVCAGGVGPDWACDGTDRVRCDLGTVVREPCPEACGGGVCMMATGVPDADGDGAGEDVDCDDADATRYPGAPETCEDGIDSDCDGADVSCDGPDASIPLPDGGGMTGSPDAGTMPPGWREGDPLTGGCSAAPVHSGNAGWLLLLALPWLLRRRR